ncbi:MAG: bifunctional oligoribonuclease/PAP phosphatase NrnA, partial [Deltaproteobacteria bacterium]|nr:bifunctional oligoribonuclease/PAP phosphatase NrnA [Deltaproteobacteria bacterium]MBW2164724.1 bifunctional oligoribonuclease/PAP phosphatase NrnA [Deltaproteobacteria bacterium]
MKKIINHLKNSNHIIIASHKDPDGDAIGSLIAMGLALEALNKNITLYNESSIPS